MKDFKYYSTVSAPFATRRQFETTTWFTGDKVFATQVGEAAILYADGSAYPATEKHVLKTMRKDVKIDGDAYNKAAAAYHGEQSALMDEFRADLFADLGIADNPRRDKLFSKAWELGHSSGFAEVHSVAADLVELIED